MRWLIEDRETPWYLRAQPESTLMPDLTFARCKGCGAVYPGEKAKEVQANGSGVKLCTTCREGSNGKH